jgi:hypothetical protein
MDTRSALRTIRPRTLPRMLLAAAHVWLIVLRIRAAHLFTRHRSTTMSTATMIHDEVLRWPGVTEAPHRFGGVEFRLGKRELGHLHGDYLADLPFPVRVREELVWEGKAMPHHILPQSGWVSYPIRDEAAVPGAIALFRLAYDRAIASRKKEH